MPRAIPPKKPWRPLRTVVGSTVEFATPDSVRRLAELVGIDEEIALRLLLATVGFRLIPPPPSPSATMVALKRLAQVAGQLDCAISSLGDDVLSILSLNFNETISETEARLNALQIVLHDLVAAPRSVGQWRPLGRWNPKSIDAEIGGRVLSELHSSRVRIARGKRSPAVRVLEEMLRQCDRPPQGALRLVREWVRRYGKR